MAIEFTCPQCQKLLRTSDDKAGRTAQCPYCSEPIVVPAPYDSADDDAEFDVGHAASVPTESDSFGYSSDYDAPYDDSAEPASAWLQPDAQGETKRCPMCGEEVKAAAVRCRHCGEELAPFPIEPERESYLRPHRGGLILALAILGWVICFIFAIPAWVMANDDLSQMAAGQMDPSGEGLTTAGKVIAIIQLALLAVGILFLCLMFGLAGIAG